MPTNFRCVHPRSHGTHRGDTPIPATLWSACQVWWSCTFSFIKAPPCLKLLIPTSNAVGRWGINVEFSPKCPLNWNNWFMLHKFQHTKRFLFRSRRYRRVTVSFRVRNLLLHAFSKPWCQIETSPIILIHPVHLIILATHIHLSFSSIWQGNSNNAERYIFLVPIFKSQNPGHLVTFGLGGWEVANTKFITQHAMDKVQ